MRVFLCSLCLLATIISFAKAPEADTSFTPLPHWKKAETKTLIISRDKKRTENGKVTNPFEFTYLAKIIVLDSTADGYKLQWNFHFTEEFKKANPGIEKVMPVYNGMKMIYTTEADGSFKELLNWQEVADAYFQMTILSAGRKIEDSIMAKVRLMADTREKVEAAFIKEIRLYHLPYGAEFSTTVNKQDVLNPNPFGGPDMPAVASQQITVIAPANKSYTLLTKQELDPAGTKILMNSLFKVMDLPMDSINKYAGEMLANFQIKDQGEFTVTAATGWITQIRHERIGNTGMIKLTEINTIMMEGVKPQ